jgi:hypothetical protein
MRALLVFLLLGSVHASPYMVTSYYMRVESTVDPGTTRSGYTRTASIRTRTEYISPTITASPLRASTTISDHLFTHVHVELPAGAGVPLTQFSSTSTLYGVPITYSRCTSRVDDSSVAVPPFSTTPIYVRVPPDISPLTRYTTTSHLFGNVTSTYPVVIAHPTDVDPVEYASFSSAYQPVSCLAATTSVDYRNACEFGPVSRRNPSSDISCGEMNPCCFDCREKMVTCVRNCDGYDFRDFRDCTDGRRYYADSEPSIHEIYTLDPPKETVGEWSDDQRAGETSAPQGGGQGGAAVLKSSLVLACGVPAVMAVVSLM